MATPTVITNCPTQNLGFSTKMNIQEPGPKMSIQESGSNDSDSESCSVGSSELDHIILDVPDDREWAEKLFDRVTGIKDPLLYSQVKTIAHLSIVGIFFTGVGIGVMLWVKSDSFSVFIEWVNSIGVWGYVMMTFATVLFAFPWMLGYGLLAVVNGFLYGWWALLILTIGNIFGYPLCFVLVRYFARDWFLQQTKTIKYIKAGIYAVSQHPIKFTLILRMAPLAPGMVNSLIAVSSIDWFTFLWASVIGHIPKDIMLVMFGHYTAKSIAEIMQGKIEMDAANISLIVFQGIAMILAVGLLAYFGKKSMEQMEQEMEQEQVSIAQ